MTDDISQTTGPTQEGARRRHHRRSHVSLCRRRYQSVESIDVSGSGSVAKENSVAAGEGGIAIGRDLVIADPETLWKLLGQPRPTADLTALTERYLAYLVDRYRYLDFRGMGVSDRVPLRLPLVDMYVPLKARIELPEGETWARELRLAGRQTDRGGSGGHRASA